MANKWQLGAVFSPQPENEVFPANHLWQNKADGNHWEANEQKQRIGSLHHTQALLVTQNLHKINNNNTTTILRPSYRSTWRILLVQSFTACMPLLTATSAFELGKRCSSFSQQSISVCLPENLAALARERDTFNGPFPGLPGWASTRKVKPICILLKQETVTGSGISWAICKSAPRSRQITTPAPHHSVFLQAGCPSCWPTNSVKALKA